MSNYIYSLGILSWLGDNVIDGIASFFYTILLWLNCIIYSFISFVYQIFLVLANGGAIFDQTIIDGLVNRIYIIIGVVILFLVAYSLLKNLVNPDEAIKGKKSPVALIKDVIISVVLIAIIPNIFDFAFAFQNSLLQENTIGKIVAGTQEGDDGINNTIRYGGYEMAKGVWQAFIHVNSDGDPSGKPYCSTAKEEDDRITSSGEECTVIMIDDNTTYSQLWENAKKNDSFYNMIGLVPRILEDEITYLFIIDIIAGVFVLFVLINYCLDMALRLVRLAVYELIAPLPILARILPNEQATKVFSNWVKAVISTFVEVFIRIAILYFAVIIISAVGSSLDNLFTGGAYTTTGTLPFVRTLAQALIIVGIVLFVKQAPAIIKEITGLDGGKYGKSLIKGAGMLATSLGGGTTATIRSFANDRDKPMGRRLGRALTAGMGANARGIWNGRKIEKFGDIPKTTGKTVSNTLGHRADVEAAGGYKAYYTKKAEDKYKDVMTWAAGSFDAQQQILNEVNAFLSDAKAVKSTTEGLVRDKKYLFTMADKSTGEGYTLYEKDNDGKDKVDSNGNKIVLKSSTGEEIKFNTSTSLSEIEAVIEALKSSGNVEDARLANKINNDMQLRIKKIGQQMAIVAYDKNYSVFNVDYMVNDDKGIEEEAMPTLETAKSQFEIVEKRMAKNNSLDAVTKFNTIEGKLKPNNVSKLADQLEIQQAQIQQSIKLEQERRKANEKK